MLKNMELLRESIKCKDQNGNRITLFDGCTVQYEFPCGYRRYVGFGKTEIDDIPKRQIIDKTSDGNGFFPTIASHKVVLHCKSEYYLPRIQKYISFMQISIP
jgi:hypothetical protein